MKRHRIGGKPDGLQIVDEIERLTFNATTKREDLLRNGLRKSKRKKGFTVVAGVLALSSAVTITTIMANVVGNSGTELIAAIIATISGVISLVITSYYSDDEIVSMLSGSAKYLSLRESVYRLVVHPKVSQQDRYDRLTELQDEYARLDETYSKYFSYQRDRNTNAPPLPMSKYEKKISELIRETANEESERIYREMKKSGTFSENDL